MKKRGVFSYLRLRVRYLKLRRELRAASRTIDDLKRRHASEKEKIHKFYTTQLEIERKRNDIIHNTYGERFLQHLGLQGLTIATAGVEDRVKTVYSNDENLNIEDTLSSDAKDLLDDVKAKFFADGEAEGKSYTEIESFWKLKKPEIINELPYMVQ